jgi:hypothetical protein
MPKTIWCRTGFTRMSGPNLAHNFSNKGNHKAELTSKNVTVMYMKSKDSDDGV